jgi:hypothetical protein
VGKEIIETYTEATLDEFLKAGARHIIVEMGAPWDLAAVEKLVRWRDARQ